MVSNRTPNGRHPRLHIDTLFQSVPPPPPPLSLQPFGPPPLSPLLDPTSASSPDLNLRQPAPPLPVRAQRAFMWLAPVAVVLATTVLAYVTHARVAEAQVAGMMITVNFRCNQFLNLLANDIGSVAVDQVASIRAFVAASDSLNSSALAVFGTALYAVPYARVNLMQRVPASARPAWEAAHGGTVISAIRTRLYMDAAPQCLFTAPPTCPPAPDDIALPRILPEPPAANNSVVYWPNTGSIPPIWAPSPTYLNLYVGARIPAIDAVVSGRLNVSPSDIIIPTRPLRVEPSGNASDISPSVQYFTAPVLRQNDQTYIVNTVIDLGRYLQTNLQPNAEKAEMALTLSVGDMQQVVQTQSRHKTIVSMHELPTTATASTQIVEQTWALTCNPTAALAKNYITTWPLVSSILVGLGGNVIALALFYGISKMRQLWKVESLLDAWRTSSTAILLALPIPLALVTDYGAMLTVNEPFLTMTERNTESLESSIDRILCLEKPEPIANANAVDDDDDLPSSLARDPSDDHRLHAFINDRQRDRESSWSRGSTIHSSSNALPGPLHQPLLDEFPYSVSIGIPPSPGPRATSTSNALMSMLRESRRIAVQVEFPASVAEPPSIIAIAGAAQLPVERQDVQLVMLTDISKVRARDRALAARAHEAACLHRMQSALLLFLAHELRNPLYVVLGTISELADATPPRMDAQTAAQVTNAVDQCTEVLNTMVQRTERG
ncbi:hypothetical protein BC828DRAFT_140742 [Blastocladiella britannica]|nr:hypothetical protein BC828DRAFT_140742 [Blastocladiella britannica]